MAVWLELGRSEETDRCLWLQTKLIPVGDNLLHSWGSREPAGRHNCRRTGLLQGSPFDTPRKSRGQATGESGRAMMRIE